MGNTEAIEARAREVREAEAREARARETVARWRAFGVCVGIGGVGAAVLEFKLMVLVIIVVIVTAGELWQIMAGVLLSVLGCVGAVVLGSKYWLLSWILPVVGFVTMETWWGTRRPVLLDLVPEGVDPALVLLTLERLVLIFGVALLGLEWMFALHAAIAVIVAAVVSDSFEMGVKMVVAVGIVGVAVQGWKWGLVWILAITVIGLPPILAYSLLLLVYHDLTSRLHELNSKFPELLLNINDQN